MDVVESHFQEARAQRPVTTQEEYNSLLARVVLELIDREVEAQAGRDMGVAGEIIAGGVDSILERRLSLQGLIGRGKQNQEQGLDRREAEEGVAASIHRRNLLWSNLGLQPGARGRVFVDRFVRPGELYAAYEINLDVLGEPDQVRIRDLVLLEEALGDLETAREQALSFRAEVLGGQSDLGELILQWSAVKGTTAPLPLPLGGTGADLDPWLATAQVGEVSPVVPARDATTAGRIAGYRFVQVTERTPGEPPPPFVDRPTQQYLHDRLIDMRDEGLLGRLDERMKRSAYVWTAFQ